MNQIHFDELTPQIVLGVAAHPDDLDFGAAGAMAVFAQNNAEVYYLILTDGGKGSNNPDMTPSHLMQIRHDEQRAAAQAIGAKDVFFLSYPDGMLENTIDLKRDIVRHIRKLKPDVLITMDPSVLYTAEQGSINHPDHRAAGQAALDATYPLARDRLSFPELLDEGLEPHKVETILLFNVKEQNFIIDVSDTFEQKLRALEAHKSQFPDNAKAVKDIVTMLAKDAGALFNHEYAEAFIRIDIH